MTKRWSQHEHGGLAGYFLQDGRINHECVETKQEYVSSLLFRADVVVVAAAVVVVVVKVSQFGQDISFNVLL